MVLHPEVSNSQNVGRFPIRAGGPSRLLRLRQIKLPHGHANRSRSELTAVPYLLLLPSPPPPIQTLHCSWTTLSQIGHSTSQHLPLWIFSWSGTSKVCITKHLNIIVQLGPWIPAGHSQVFDCVSCNSLEDSEVLCTW